MDTRSALARLEVMFSGLTPQNVGDIGRLYTDDAYFKDPFNEVRGSAAIERIFAHMFEQLIEPRFVILQRAVDGPHAWLTWNLEYRLRPAQAVRRIHGATHLSFSEDGRVDMHRDYWDAAGELYESIPLLGGLLRVIRGRLRAS
jgi:hypothetical protein